MHWIRQPRNNFNRPCSSGLLFGRYEADGQPVLIFGNTLPWNICVNASHTHGDMPIEAAGLLADYLRDNAVKISGITARERICKAFMRAYGGRFTLGSAMDIMVLEELIEPKACAGRARKSTIDDLELILSWKLAFYREVLNQEPSLESLRERNTNSVAGGIISLWEVDGTPVAMAETTRQMAHGTSVSSVYTLPEHRGHGYAQNVVATICREKLGQGNRYCTLFVNKKNPVSNKAYKNIGFKILEDAFEYKLDGDAQ